MYLLKMKLKTVLYILSKRPGTCLFILCGLASVGLASRVLRNRGFEYQLPRCEVVYETNTLVDFLWASAYKFTFSRSLYPIFEQMGTPWGIKCHTGVITKKTIAHMVKWSCDWKFLDFNDCLFEDADWNDFSQLRAIQCLNIDSCYLMPNGIEGSSESGGLSNFIDAQTDLRIVDIANCCVDVSTASAISRKTKKRVNLLSVQLSQEALRRLLSSEKIRFLFIKNSTGCKFGDDEIELLINSKFEAFEFGSGTLSDAQISVIESRNKTLRLEREPDSDLGDQTGTAEAYYVGF